MAAERRLLGELQKLKQEKWVHIDVDEANIRKWNLGLMVVNPDSPFYGGYFKAEMTFSNDYPNYPPTFKFSNKLIHHPNVYTDGRLCISILHAPGEDEMSGEQASERWSPLQGVESVLLSVLLLLDNPEINSPANVDASVLFRDNKDEFYKRAKAAADKSRKDMPAEVHFPTQEELNPVRKKDAFNDDDFWNETDEDDFDASDSDEDMEEEEEDDDDDD